MRFLVDNAVSPIIAAGLRDAGHDAVHVLQYGMAASSDTDILIRAATENRIVITADSDFSMLLATQQLQKPSVILFRGNLMQNPHEQLASLLVNLPVVQEPLEQGSIVIFDRIRQRIRLLPI
ncbi:MAG: DUF5615 family PIN-like protein [Chloroflexota bacterium]|nr:DUF5615 family PIN-like protein [Chloroflexota bacterium]